MKIGEIKKVYESLDFTDKKGICDFIDEYGEDDRAGVVTLVTKAQKRLDAYEMEVERSVRMLQFENKYYQQGAIYICGIDEVGRGPFAGPVVAGAVILPRDELILELNDSKQLTRAKREELYDVITKKAVAWTVGIKSEKVIDDINILQATFAAMREAVSKLSVEPDILLNDAVDIPGLDIKQVPIIKGDTLSASIAAASIIAKVTRDRMMEEYDKVYPGYYFGENSGYGVPRHIAALKEIGPCPIHRRTFIKKYI